MMAFNPDKALVTKVVHADDRNNSHGSVSVHMFERGEWPRSGSGPLVTLNAVFDGDREANNSGYYIELNSEEILKLVKGLLEARSRLVDGGPT